MRKIFYLSLALFLCISNMVYAVSASDIQPRPHEIKESGKFLTWTGEARIVADKSINTHIVAKLKNALNISDSKQGVKVIIGKRGDASVRKYNKHIPKKTEGYYLAVGAKEIVVAGNDERGTYYGVLSLAQMLEDNRLPIVEITDYPDVAFRGVVEGFYGTPWSFDARLSQIKFYGDNKLNTYIYGPKDDPYHRSPRWREAYPAQEAKNIMKLVQVANENMVDFVWAIHPGNDIRWTIDDRDALISKLELMYGLGVRAFAVFFDDISGEGTKAEKQAELLNYIDDTFIQKKGDVKPLVLCPTEYNKSWSNIEKGYLPTLGSELNKGINVMWTGDRVCIDITEGTLDWVNPHLQRPAYIWWNFPVTDYVRDHLLMGPVYGNDLNIADKVSGFVANPMEHAEASKVAIYSVADYTWNMEAYDSDAAWKRAINYLMPNDAEALQTFANHNSDLGANGHLYRKDESVALAPYLEEALAALKLGSLNKQSVYYKVISDEFKRIAEAADILLASEDNDALLEEIGPWVLQFKKVGDLGQAVLALESSIENPKEFLRNYKYVQALYKLQYTIDQSYNQNPYQPGVKTASFRVMPFISTLFEVSVNRYNAKYNAELSSQSSYNPHHIETDLEQIKNVPLQTKTDRVILPPVLEIVKWKRGETIELVLDKAYQAKQLAFDLSQEGLTAWLEVSISANGTDWRQLSFEQTKNRVAIDLKGEDVQRVKFVNTLEDKEVKFRQIQLQIKE